MQSNNPTQQLLDTALTDQIITPDQHQQLLARYEQLVSHNFDKNTQIQTNDSPKFVLSHLLYYLGGMIAIGAMSVFMTLGFSLYGSGAMMTICVCYAVLASCIARFLYQKNLKTPYSILLGFILCLVPLFTFALQHYLGFWQEYSDYQQYHQWVSPQWLILEVATLLVGVAMLWRFRRSFLTLPIALTLWYLSMDIAPLLTQSELDWDLRQLVSVYFGLAVIVGAIWIDIRQHTRQSVIEQDFAFWLYIVGVMTFWGGLSLQDSDSELAKFMYCMINVALLLLGVVLRRRVFAVFGGMGIAMYLGHLAYEVFKDSMIFPLIVALIGFAVIFLGVFWQKNESRIYAKLLSFLPTHWQHTLKNLHQ